MSNVQQNEVVLFDTGLNSLFIEFVTQDVTRPAEWLGGSGQPRARSANGLDDAGRPGT